LLGTIRRRFCKTRANAFNLGSDLIIRAISREESGDLAIRVQAQTIVR
jgi:hypothetical protein